jgi:hypothetical protein
MEAILVGTVVKSAIQEKSQKIKTAIYTSNREMNPTIVTTKKIIPEGSKVRLRVRISLYLDDKGKAYLVTQESDDQTQLDVKP